MSAEMEKMEMAVRPPMRPAELPAVMMVQRMAVECVVYDQADRPKRRHLLPLSGLLAPLRGGVSGLAADAS